MENFATPVKPPVDRLTLILRYAVAAVVALAVLVGAWYAYAYLSTPQALRYPAHQHYHFRLQIIVDGQPVNFGEAKYQTAFDKDICTAALTQEPVHFHDNLDQFIHIHWNHLTGGIVLKDYGWNLIGGAPNTLGYRFDSFPKLVRVPIHGHDLPSVKPGDRYYIYQGDAKGYTKRNWNDFVNEDLQDFFAGKTRTSFLQRLIAPNASAASEEELSRINDVLGSVVIFAQKDAPTDAQIKDRFNHLIPLPESSCGG